MEVLASCIKLTSRLDRIWDVRTTFKTSRKVVLDNPSVSVRDLAFVMRTLTGVRFNSSIWNFRGMFVYTLKLNWLNLTNWVLNITNSIMRSWVTELIKNHELLWLIHLTTIELEIEFDWNFGCFWIGAFTSLRLCCLSPHFARTKPALSH